MLLFRLAERYSNAVASLQELGRNAAEKSLGSAHQHEEEFSVGLGSRSRTDVCCYCHNLVENSYMLVVVCKVLIGRCLEPCLPTARSPDGFFGRSFSKMASVCIRMTFGFQSSSAKVLLICEIDCRR